jgi:DNA-binding NarL/FixJ family response regulator
MIRVVLADDQMLMRQGVKGLLDLTEDLRVVGEASDGDEALRLIRAVRPDAALLDVRMPKRSGVEVLKDLRISESLPPTILLTTFDDDAALLEGMRAGALGFLLKDVSFEALTDALRRVARGETLMRPAISERVLRGVDRLGLPFESLDMPDRLTRRELEVLRLVAGGFSNREIAEALGMSEGTVKNHASSILSKLGVRDRTRAVLKALDLGYL